MLVSDVYLTPSTFTDAFGLNTNISFMSWEIVNVITVSDSNFKQRVKVNPLYVIVPLEVDKFPLISKKSDSFPCSWKLWVIWVTGTLSNKLSSLL